MALVSNPERSDIGLRQTSCKSKALVGCLNKSLPLVGCLNLNSLDFLVPLNCGIVSRQKNEERNTNNQTKWHWTIIQPWFFGPASMRDWVKPKEDIIVPSPKCPASKRDCINTKEQRKKHQQPNYILLNQSLPLIRVFKKNFSFLNKTPYFILPNKI